MSTSAESSVIFLPFFGDKFSVSSTHVERFKPGMVYQWIPPVLPPSTPILPPTTLRRSFRASGPPNCYGFSSHMISTTTYTLSATLFFIAIPTGYSLVVKKKMLATGYAGGTICS